MGLVAVPSGLWFPWPWDISLPSSTAFTISTTEKKVAFIIQVPRTGTLDKFEWRTLSVANNPDSGIRCSFQDIDLATGDPDGTQDQFRTITGTISANTWQVPGLLTSDGTDGGTKRSVTRGQLLACVMENESFTAGDSFQVAYTAQGGGVGLMFPTVRTFSGATWGDAISYPLLALKYSDGTYAYVAPGVLPVKSLVSVSRNQASTPDETAQRFKLPFACEVDACWLHTDLEVNTDIVLYDAADAVLASVSVDIDVWGAYISTHFGIIQFDTPVLLQANQVYRLAQKPMGSAFSNVVKGIEVASAAMLDAVYGVEWYWSERTDGGAWTDTNTRVMLGGLRISAIEAPTLTELRSPIQAALGW